MASDYSFDVVAHFDLQELKNAVDQVRREILTRYDFKDSNATVELTDDKIVIVAPDDFKVKAVGDVLMQKVINRKLSPKILEFKDVLPAGGNTMKQEIVLKKVLDSETCKDITKLLKENFPKVKGSIYGESVRVSSKDKDNLQEVISYLKQKEADFKLPLTFDNYR